MDRETQALMEKMAEEAAQAAVKQTLLTLGIDPEDPLEAQKDMATLRELRGLVDDEEFQRDMLHLRQWRKTMDQVRSKGMIAALGMICLGGASLILYAFRVKIFGAP